MVSHGVVFVWRPYVEEGPGVHRGGWVLATRMERGDLNIFRACEQEKKYMKGKRKLQGLDTCSYREFSPCLEGERCPISSLASRQVWKMNPKKTLFKCQPDGESGKIFGAATQNNSRNGLFLTLSYDQVNSFPLAD